MRWGSTKPGEIFTGARRWQVEVKQAGFSLQVNGQPPIAVHLAQLRRVRVSTGVLWATCHFDYLVDRSKITATVDGIPNAHAVHMQRAVADLTVTVLSLLVTAQARALEIWLDRLARTLAPNAETIVSGEAIAQAVAAPGAPPTPAPLSWDEIYEHPQIAAARETARGWTSWEAPPSIALAKRLHAHNQAAFDVALARWRQAVMDLDLARWIPKGTARRQLARHPAPEWPGRTWSQLVGDASPEATLHSAFDDHNTRHLARQRIACKHFFDTVEKNPLTDEQIDPSPASRTPG